MQIGIICDKIKKKDIKAVIKDGKIVKVGIEFFDDALSAQPLYKLYAKDWTVWLNEIVRFCESDNRKCYAENAFNLVSYDCNVLPLDVKAELCNEIDNPDDLAVIAKRLLEL